MKSPVSLQSVSHPSTLVPTTPLSASRLIRSATAKWTVQTARMKDPSAVMFVLHVISFCYVVLLSCKMLKVIIYSNTLHGQKYADARNYTRLTAENLIPPP